MPLPTPNLDDRSFQQLVDDAKRMVQKHCPEWTNHNVSDPGVTLIEAFAQMTDQLLYRVNQVPERLYVKFLDLIGLHLLPPTAARVPLTFWLTSAVEDSPLTISRGTSAATLTTQSLAPVIFSTSEELVLPPSSLSHLFKVAGPPDPNATADPEMPEPEPDPQDYTVSLELGSRFTAFSNPPVTGDFLLLGLDTAVPNCAVSIDFLGKIEGVGVDPRNPPLAWESWDGDQWSACELSLDQTGGLNRTGSVVVHVPGSHQSAPLKGEFAGWLRARITEPEEGQPRYTSSPVVQSLAVGTVGGTVEAVHAEIIGEETLGTCEGVASQRFRLSRSPVLNALGTPVVETSTDEGWQEWTAVESFADSGPDDLHFHLDAVTGEVRTGPVVRLEDGTLRQYGAIPEPGAVARIRGYATGGGSRGNVARGAIETLTSSIAFIGRVENRFPASGGTEGETLPEAMDRGPLLLRTRSRAVTAEDFEYFAREAAPEAGRLRCLPAGTTGVEPGAVRLLVVPSAHAEEGRIDLQDLIPPPALLARVAQRLDEVRLVGTRIVVEPPFYRGITVVARVIARPQADRVRIRNDALRQLYTLLSPLPGGGPQGAGWPFGRPVQAGEIFAALQRVRGVDMADDVRLFSANPVTGEHGEERQRIHLEPNSLVFSHGHQVRVEDH